MTGHIHRLRLVLVLIIVWIAVACAAVTLREAQDHFNKGAEMELRAMDRSFLSDKPDANPGDAFAALNEYRLAYLVATRLIDEESMQLKQDKLLGATYVLKAMSLWRISDLGSEIPADVESPSATHPAEGVANPRQELLTVLTEIEQLQGNEEILLGTRDKVLHRALYGFYDHDGGRAENDYAKARVWFNSAYKRLGESLASDVPERHPIRVYVGSAQLRTMAAWNLAIYIERKNCKCDSEPKPPCCELIDDDQNEIKKKTKETICGLQPFWDGKEEVKNSLDQLSANIGLPFISNHCP